MGGGKNKKKSSSKGKSEVPTATFDYDVPAAAEEIEIDQALTPAELKAKGNECVQSGDHKTALAYFTRAIEVGPPAEELHIFHSNRSLAALSVQNYALATEDAEKCVSLKPDWGKGYSRLGSAHFYAGRFAEAASAYGRGLAAEPTNDGLLKGLQAANESLKAAQGKQSVNNGKQPSAFNMPPAPSAPTAAAAPPQAEPAPKKEAGKGPVIGIDLGTTYSCVAVAQAGAGRIEIIANADGSRTTPSWVAFSQHDGTRLVGQGAKNQGPANPKNTVNDAKRLIGRAFHDAGLQADLPKLSYDVEEGDEGKPMVSLSSAVWDKPRLFAPEQISAMVLEQLKADAEAFLGEPVSRAVITVPAHFNDAQRQATKDAGNIAGLQVLRIINEPTAAALAYGLDKANKDKSDKKVLIFDLGGGTFDVSVLSIEGGIFEVLSTGGNTRLGGEDFDSQVVDWLWATFLKTHKGATLSDRAKRRLYVAAERAKRQLSAATTTDVEIESFYEGEDLKIQLSRAKFEQLNQVLFEQTLAAVKAVLKDSNLAKKAIDEVVLVGGSTRVPKIRALLSEFFDGKELCSTINPDEAVAYGAAVQAGVLSGGLASAGGQLAKVSDSLVLMDVVPLSLGIETTGKVMSTVVKRNTAIPCRKSDTFTTEEDWQTEVDICVFEGERASTDACHELGKFTISGLERAKRGEPQVVVTFDIDANGILSVNAVDKTTNAKASITITATAARNSKEDVARMVKEAERFAAEDAQLKRKADARRALEDLIYDIADNDDASDKVKRAAEDAEEWVQSNFDRCTVQQLEEKMRSLRTA